MTRLSELLNTRSDHSDLPSGVRDINSNQTGRTGARHEGFRPAILGIKVLLITPQHFELGAGRLRPNELLINVSLPLRRLTGHEIDFEKVRPTDRAVLN